MSGTQPEPTNNRKLVHCSFCSKSQRQVTAIVAGPGVYICNECVYLCIDILVERRDPNIHRHADRNEPREGDLVLPITLPDEAHGAGFVLLSFLPVVLDRRLSDIDVRIRFSFEERTIRLLATGGEAHHDEVIAEINGFGRFVRGLIKPAEYLGDKALEREWRARIVAAESQVARYGQGRHQTTLTLDRLRDALGWILCREIDDVPELLS